MLGRILLVFVFFLHPLHGLLLKDFKNVLGLVLYPFFFSLSPVKVPSAVKTGGQRTYGCCVLK